MEVGSGCRVPLNDIDLIVHLLPLSITVKAVSYIDTKSRCQVDRTIEEGGHPHGNFYQIRMCQFSYRCLVKVQPFVMIQGQVMHISCLVTNILHMNEERWYCLHLSKLDIWGWGFLWVI